MKIADATYLVNNYSRFRQDSITGRYVTLKNIEPIINNLPSIFKVLKIGNSYNGNSIYKIEIGTGKIKILIWSQMHGNETTGTKAIFDIFNFFIKTYELEELKDTILNKCTLIFIPMLNPDGATLYTRKNAQDIDLNRDAVDLKAPESRILKDILYKFSPKYCFNLHDQRTIFSVEKDNNPATLSFLAPSENKERTLTNGRKETMLVISSIYNTLKTFLPNQIGRFTDEFYPTATGDNFQKAGFNTILIEAGHYKDDYARETTRKFNFISLIAGFFQIATNSHNNYADYYEIPNNNKNYYDIIYSNLRINGEKMHFGVIFKEKLKDEEILFIPKIKRLNNLLYVNANKYVNEKYCFNDIKEFESLLSKIC